MAMIQIEYCGDKRTIEEKKLPKYQQAKEEGIRLAMKNGSSRQEAEKYFYLKILKESK